MPTKSTIRQARYDKDHTKKIIMKLNTTTDRDILDRLDSVPSKQGYIKRLIRQDMEREARGVLHLSSPSQLPELPSDVPPTHPE